MHYIKEIYFIICEGNSEFAYIQELNRYLENNNYLFILNPIRIGNGHFKAVRKKYNDFKKANPRNQNIIVWVDKDVYIRNDNGDKKAYENKWDVPNFIFNLNNFEDFLVMHMPTHILEKWQDICRKKKHFEKPLCEDEYLPLYQKSVFPKYEKGNIPFEIKDEYIQQALLNQKNTNILFKSDFLDLLSDLIELSQKKATNCSDAEYKKLWNKNISKWVYIKRQ